jgi:membrane protein YdbS with pleckstrin-like domain
MSTRMETATAWLYRGIWRVIVDLFRVPDQPPTLPVRSGEFHLSFPPAAGFLKYMKFWFWILLALTDVALAAGYIAIAYALCEEGLWWVSGLLLPVALFLIIAPDVLAYIAIHLRYDSTWYVMTDRSLRIRRGIWIIHETTITFENIQNLKVQQGPLQRHYGIANLVVETAGAGGGGHQKNASAVSNRGVIEGVENAHELRDRVLMRMRQSNSAGLGDDSQEQARGPSEFSHAHLAVLREIRNETRALTA